MHSSSIIAVLCAATSVFAAPTVNTWSSEDGSLHVRSVGNQGDGVYMAVFDDEGKADVQFTPFDDVANTTISERDVEEVHDLSKRAGTSCGGGRARDLGSLDAANGELARISANKAYPKHAWGWVHKNGETSYLCNYQQNYLTESLIIEMHSVVTGKCGRDGYGFDRRTNGGGAVDLAVGRTYSGQSFCAKGFTGF